MEIGDDKSYKVTLIKNKIYMLTPFELILLLVVLCLLVVTIAVCTKSTKNTSAIEALKQYLNLLLTRFNNTAGINAEAERSKMEKLFNQVKFSCNEQFISSDSNLKMKLSRVCKDIHAITELHPDDPDCSWLKLQSAAADFSAIYFPG